MSTIVVNLMGASGIGKSTTAAALFAEFKLAGFNVELVREYIKSLVWRDIKVGSYDQCYIFGQQARAESILYGKLDYIITDSPLLLSAFYETRYTGREIIAPAVLNFLDFAKENGIEHRYYFLKRNKPYDSRGRYETEEQSKENHELLKEYLRGKNINWIDVEVPDKERNEFIMRDLGLWNLQENK